MAPLPKEVALAQLEENRTLWATNPALSGDHAGLEAVLHGASLWFHTEYYFEPEGPQRDAAVRGELKTVANRLEQVGHRFAAAEDVVRFI